MALCYSFVDIGDKSYGVIALQQYLGIDHNFSLHFGDGFYNTGRRWVFSV